MQIFRLSNNFQTIANVIFHVIFHVVFLQSLNHSTVPERSFFYTFPSKSSYALGKRSPSKCSFSDFQLFAWKLTKFCMTFFKSRVSFFFKFFINFSYVSWHIIPTKFFSWSIICFGQKEPISLQFFKLLSALMKVQPIPQVIFETTTSEFIQILNHCSVSWEITPLHEWKEPVKVKFSDFWVVGWKLTKFFMSYLKPQISFSFKFTSLFSVMGEHSSALF